jgi:hypothetical protein
MTDTGIAEEIATLRSRIADAEASVARCKSLIAARHEAGTESAAEEAELKELIEARDSMVLRLSRLESCQRAL